MSNKQPKKKKFVTYGEALYHFRFERERIHTEEGAFIYPTKKDYMIKFENLDDAIDYTSEKLRKVWIKLGLF
jgi:hypothetical protein